MSQAEVTILDLENHISLLQGDIEVLNSTITYERTKRAALMDEHKDLQARYMVICNKLGLAESQVAACEQMSTLKPLIDLCVQSARHLVLKALDDLVEEIIPEVTNVGNVQEKVVGHVEEAMNTFDLSEIAKTWADNSEDAVEEALQNALDEVINRRGFHVRIGH